MCVMGSSSSPLDAVGEFSQSQYFVMAFLLAASYRSSGGIGAIFTEPVSDVSKTEGCDCQTDTEAQGF